MVGVRRSMSRKRNPLMASLFPLGVGSETALLRLMGPGVVWVAALLASMLALTRMFASDYADGTLEQLALSPHPLTMLVLAKIAAHWLASGLPLVIIAPLLGLQFDLSAEAQLVLLASLLLGTPTRRACTRWCRRRSPSPSRGRAP